MTTKKTDKGMVEKAKAGVGKAAEKASEVAGAAVSAADKASELAMGMAEGKLNRTGIDMSPKHSKEVIAGAQQSLPSAPGDVNALSEMRVAYARDSEPMGSVPPPASAKGLTQTAAAALKGDKASFFIDKLGERLAFERTGVRLYEELILTFDAHGGYPGGPTREQLDVLRDEEAAHFVIVKEAMESLGADATAITPSANLASVESMGLLQVLGDPRSRLADGLHAIRVAELADREGWDTIVALAEENAQPELATRFRVALADEEKHLAWVREWLNAHSQIETRVAAPRGGKRAQPAAPPS